MSILSKDYFHNEDAAFAHLEAVLWPEGPNCPHCGALDKIYPITGKSARAGLKKCGHCKKQFTVRVGTVFESSHVPLHKWLQATYLMTSSKKGISAHQLHRTLEVTYKTAWFMAHRIREAMRAGELPPVGGEGKAVEVDETFIGQKEGRKKGRGYAHKEAVFALVERGGRVQSFHVPNVKAETLKPIINAQIKYDTMLMSDEAGQYRPIGKDYDYHFAVSHGIGEYVRGGAHTNTIEGYFSIFKRGMKGIYQHCSQKHLKRYLAEFDFRYNERHADDINRNFTALRGIMGKRLTYRSTNAA